MESDGISDWRMRSGKEFQGLGACTQKACVPQREIMSRLVRGTVVDSGRCRR